MKLIAVLPLVLVLQATAETSHPVGSVIKLLKELRARVVKEGKTEEATFLKFSKWCASSGATLSKAIKSEVENIDTLGDTVKSKTSEDTDVSNNIEFLVKEIAKYAAESASANKDRKEAKNLFKREDANMKSTIKAIGAALKALKGSKKGAFLEVDTPVQQDALRQLMEQPLVLEQLSDEESADLTAAAFGDDEKPVQPLKALKNMFGKREKPVSAKDILAKEKYAKSGKTYTFKSGGVIGLLDKLHKHFQNKMVEKLKEETHAQNAYDVARTARKDAIRAAKKVRGAKTTLLAEVKSDLNTAKSNRKDEKHEKKSDSATLSDTKRTCAIKNAQWQERSELRNHEVAAMTAAIEVLAEVSGVRTKAPKTKKLPTGPKLFFLQVDEPKKMRAVTLIRQAATAQHSKQLARFADEIAARLGGPFDSVNQMVQKMIFRLMNEQKQEDEHKHWCDLELEKSTSSKTDKTNKIKQFDARLKDARARVSMLQIKIRELDDKASKLTTFMAEANQVRMEGKKENTVAIKDAQDAQSAIAKAEAVLTSYYKESGMIAKKAWEFLQAPEPVKLPKEPSSWGKSYTGVTDPTKADEGVIAVLKATGADFAKMEAETRAQEITDQKQFDTDMKDSKIDKAATLKESEMKSDEMKRTSNKINAVAKQRKHVASERSAVKQYLKDLQPACGKANGTYKARKANRASEIKALQKAQVILRDAFGAKKGALLQTIGQHA